MLEEYPGSGMRKPHKALVLAVVTVALAILAAAAAGTPRPNAVYSGRSEDHPQVKVHAFFYARDPLWSGKPALRLTLSNIPVMCAANLRHKVLPELKVSMRIRRGRVSRFHLLVFGKSAEVGSRKGNWRSGRDAGMDFGQIKRGPEHVVGWLELENAVDPWQRVCFHRSPPFIATGDNNYMTENGRIHFIANRVG